MDLESSAEREPSASRPGGWSEDDVGEVSLLELVNVLLKRWKLVAGLPLAAALLAAVISLVVPAKYTAIATFVPEDESESLSLPSGLAGIAAQFGVPLPVGGSTSPAFYADVLKSRTLRDAVLSARFPRQSSEAVGDSATLLDILDIDGDSERERLEEGRKRLRKDVEVETDNETSVVSVSVEARRRELAADVANYFIELLNRFNLETRQSNAQERRRFVEGRVEAAEEELRRTEDALRLFLERNRLFQGSPELTFEYERLQRQVTIKQEVLTTLSRSYEEARIQEVNTTPVITVIDRAVPPDERSSPKRKLMVITAFFLGAVLAVFGAFSAEFAARARERDQAEYDLFNSQWSAIKSDLRSLAQRLRLRRRP